MCGKGVCVQGKRKGVGGGGARQAYVGRQCNNASQSGKGKAHTQRIKHGGCNGKQTFEGKFIFMRKGCHRERCRHDREQIKMGWRRIEGRPVPLKPWSQRLSAPVFSCSAAQACSLPAPKCLLMAKNAKNVHKKMEDLKP